MKNVFVGGLPTLDFHTGFILLHACHARVISFLVFRIQEPRYLKLSTSSSAWPLGLLLCVRASGVLMERALFFTFIASPTDDVLYSTLSSNLCADFTSSLIKTISSANARSVISSLDCNVYK